VITEAFGGPADATGTADFQALEVVTETIATALRDAGYATFTDLADADVGDLTGLTGTLTESRAEAIIQAAPQHVPVGVWLARSADVRYGRRVDETTGRGTARVLDITAATEPVGEPRYRSEGLEPDELASETGYLMKFGDVSHRGLTPFDVASLHNVPAYPLPEAALESLPAHVRADLERDGAVQMIAVYDRDPASIRRRRARLGGARLPQANRRVGGR
jgi:nitric oxide reductase NorQ protein